MGCLRVWKDAVLLGPSPSLAWLSDISLPGWMKLSRMGWSADSAQRDVLEYQEDALQCTEECDLFLDAAKTGKEGNKLQQIPYRRRISLLNQ